MKTLILVLGLTTLVGSFWMQACLAAEVVIDVQTAKEKVVYHYNKLFKDKYFFNPTDSKYRAFPSIDTAYLSWSKQTKCCWLIEGEPPAGVFVVARVDKYGKWVELVRVGFAAR